jgi:hypothetical protein
MSGFVNINRIHEGLYKPLLDDDATDNNSRIDMEHLNRTIDVDRANLWCGAL